MHIAGGEAAQDGDSPLPHRPALTTATGPRAAGACRESAELASSGMNRLSLACRPGRSKAVDYLDRDLGRSSPDRASAAATRLPRLSVLTGGEQRTAILAPSGVCRTWYSITPVCGRVRSGKGAGAPACRARRTRRRGGPARRRSAGTPTRTGTAPAGP